MTEPVVVRSDVPRQRRDEAAPGVDVPFEDVDQHGQASDGQLLAAAVAGDATAWDRIVTAHVNRVWTIATGAGLDGNDARDVCQLVWLRLAQELGSFRRKAELDVWVPEAAAAEARKLVLLRSAQARAATRQPDNVIRLEPGFAPGILTGPDA